MNNIDPQINNDSSSNKTQEKEQENTNLLDKDHERINECIHDVLTHYLSDVEGHFPGDLYNLVLSEVEKPLLETVMNHTNNNQSQTSVILGLSRTTLRKKLKQYQLD